MSREQGPRFAGMRAPAKTKFRRRLTCLGKLSHVVAAEANTGHARRTSLSISDIATEGVCMRHDIHDLLTSAIKEEAV